MTYSVPPISIPRNLDIKTILWHDMFESYVKEDNVIFLSFTDWNSFYVYQTLKTKVINFHIFCLVYLYIIYFI